MKRGFERAPVILIASVVLSSCANIDQLEFDHEARGLVHDGMPASAAVPRLRQAGFVCQKDGSDSGSFDCARIRDRLIVSCLERVTFSDTTDHPTTIAAVKAAAIACAGM